MIAEIKKIDTRDKGVQGDNKSDTTPIFTTVQEFETWLLEQSDLADKRYEFVDGRIIEKEGMKVNELFIKKFLNRIFVKTEAFNKGGELVAEVDSYIDEGRKRIPDISYWTLLQIKEARTGTRPSTLFAIEILSPNDNFQDVVEKIQDYFEAGAKLVWYILPKQEQIYAYTNPTKVQILKGDDICSASPVLVDFSFVMKEMFA